MDVADWKATKLYMMDFEGSPESGVVEYGVVELEGGEIQSVETGLCAPVGTILAKDARVHGIDQNRVQACAPFSDLYQRFVELRRNGVFAAHNRHAENRFLKDTWSHPPMVPDWRAGTGQAQEWGPWVDTLSIYRAVFPKLSSYALGDLLDTFQCRTELVKQAEAYCPADRARPHCALYDALASSLLLLRMEEEPTLAGKISIGWLLQLSHGREPQQELF